MLAWRFMRKVYEKPFPWGSGKGSHPYCSWLQELETKTYKNRKSMSEISEFR